MSEGRVIGAVLGEDLAVAREMAFLGVGGAAAGLRGGCWRRGVEVPAEGLEGRLAAGEDVFEGGFEGGFFGAGRGGHVGEGGDLGVLLQEGFGLHVWCISMRVRQVCGSMASRRAGMCEEKEHIAPVPPAVAPVSGLAPTSSSFCIGIRCLAGYLEANVAVVLLFHELLKRIVWCSKAQQA